MKSKYLAEEFMLQDEGQRVRSCNNNLGKRQNGWTCSPDRASDCVPHGVLFMLLKERRL